MAAANALTKSGLFIGQPNEFFEMLTQLASEADDARRGGPQPPAPIRRQ
jgi:hypothetical protein